MIFIVSFVGIISVRSSITTTCGRRSHFISFFFSLLSFSIFLLFLHLDFHARSIKNIKESFHGQPFLESLSSFRQGLHPQWCVVEGVAPTTYFFLLFLRLDFYTWSVKNIIGSSIFLIQTLILIHLIVIFNNNYSLILKNWYSINNGTVSKTMNTLGNVRWKKFLKKKKKVKIWQKMIKLENQNFNNKKKSK